MRVAHDVGWQRAPQRMRLSLSENEIRLRVRHLRRVGDFDACRTGEIRPEGA
jgi:hypothetical protein